MVDHSNTSPIGDVVSTSLFARPHDTRLAAIETLPSHFFHSSPPLKSHGLEPWVQINVTRSYFRLTVTLTRLGAKLAVERVNVSVG